MIWPYIISLAREDMDWCGGGRLMTKRLSIGFNASIPSSPSIC